MVRNLDKIIEEYAEKYRNRQLREFFSHGGEIEILIFPINQCNLACKYCSIYGFKKPSNVERISDKVLNRALNLIIDFKNKYPHIDVILVIHGYEPLQAGKDFFIKVAKAVRNHNIHLATQTNGVLIDEEYVKIFRDFEYSVGVSIDGPREIHNKVRIFRNGTGSYDQAFRGYELLRKYDVETGIISVATKYHVIYGADFYYKWLKENDIREVNILLPVISPHVTPFYSEIAPSKKDLLKFYEDLYEIWKNDNSGIDIAIFTSMIRNLLVGKPILRSLDIFGAASCIFVPYIDWSGRIGFCDAGIVKLNRNIFELRSLEEILFDKELDILYKRLAYLALTQCRECEYFRVCHGGCPHEALMSGNIMNKTIYCEIYKKLYTKIKDDLNKELSNKII